MTVVFQIRLKGGQSLYHFMLTRNDVNKKFYTVESIINDVQSWMSKPEQGVKPCDRLEYQQILFSSLISKVIEQKDKDRISLDYLSHVLMLMADKIKQINFDLM